MSFVLDKALEKQLTQPLDEVDKGVRAIRVKIDFNSLGEEWLYFRVVLRDAPKVSPTSPAFGRRVSRIASALRDRAAQLGVPMFASVSFIGESELPRHKRTFA